jgi:oxygen-independent coproporphyrinogen-3 oxidase
MEEQQTIIGCGAGTTTKRVFPGENRIERVENVKNVEQYIERIDEMIARKEQLLGEI